MEYLFRALESIRAKVLESPQLYLALDYDGTLTRIVSDRRRALLPKRTRELLRTLASSTRCLLTIVSGFGASRTFFTDFFRVEEYDPKAMLKLGDLSIEFASVKHYIESYAMAISGSKRLVYSADSGLCDELAKLAQGADLFLCEATRGDHDDAEWGHLEGREVGALSRKAKVKRLLLTHFWPDHDYSLNIKEAEAAFGKPVEVAKELSTYVL